MILYWNHQVSSSNIVYFDSNVPVDGDGSQENPYKYFNPSSLNNTDIVYLKNGEYDFNSPYFNVSSNMVFEGENSQDTIIKNFVLNNKNPFFNVSFVNITFINSKFRNFGILTIENCIFMQYNLINSIIS